LRSLADPGRAARSLVYLRKIEPLIFEEVIMSALEDAGVLVLRSRRYSGDGGVDGEFWSPEVGWYAVQAKRYSAHIDRQHVDAFAGVVRRLRYAGGIFAHTGKSGAGVYELLLRNGVILLSGDRLIQLIVERELVH
jgi:restriction system protein